ncbi:hypothetical protein [Lewinella sp. LCG006]
MHRKLLYLTFTQLGRWAYRYLVWWENRVLRTLDGLADYFNDHD